MSKYFLMLFLLTLSGFSQAGDDAMDDDLVSKIAVRTNSSVADVTKTLEEGCSSGMTSYIRQCAYLGQIGADIRLNETYQKLMMALVTSTARQKLVQAQRAWIAFSGCQL